MTNVFHRGRKVTSLGVLFDFTGNAVNTTVQFVSDMVKEQWVSTSFRNYVNVSNLDLPVCRSHY